MRPEALAAALRAGARGAIITPRGHNPLGAAFDAERAATLRALLRDVFVVEDDHLGPVAGVPWHSVAGASGRWAVVRSVSKWLGPDLRCAILAGDELTLARVEGRLSLGPGWVSGILQRLTARLWADPDVAALVEQAADVYTARRTALVDALAAHGLAAHAPQRPERLGPRPRRGRRRPRAARRTACRSRRARRSASRPRRRSGSRPRRCAPTRPHLSRPRWPQRSTRPAAPAPRRLSPPISIRRLLARGRIVPARELAPLWLRGR